MREKVGVMFGNPETTPGGRALKFYASAVWMFVEAHKSRELVTKKDTNVGKETKIKV